MDPETEFFLKKLESDYGSKGAGKAIKGLSKKIGWLKGWPDDKRAFWNGEAFMWRNKIDNVQRDLIARELRFLSKGRNLDLGCGGYSYVRSVGFDVAEKMLLLNGELEEKVNGDLEGPLPFADGSFDSVTLVFVLPYIKDYFSLFKEIKRILRKKGHLVIVQGETNKLWKQKHAHRLGKETLLGLLKGEGFGVRHYKKKGVEFFRCEKKIF